MSPDELAAELGISPKTLRAWLRRNFPRPVDEKNSSWHLTAEHIAAARAWRERGRRQALRIKAPRSSSLNAAPPVDAVPPVATGQMEIGWDTRLERSFREQGFRGFVALGDAVADRRAFLVAHAQDLVNPGVYAVFAPTDWIPTWNTDGPLANVINPWSLTQLRPRWIEDVELIYIGCAGATTSSRSLHKRISDLLKHAAGQTSTSGPHKGGERLWQCVGWESFKLAWKGTGPYPEPHDLEVAIGRRFERLAGQLPFANVRL